MKFTVFVSGFVIAVAAMCSPASARPINTFTQEVVTGPPIALIGGTVVDVEGGREIPDATVLIEGGRIIAMGAASAVEVPAGARKIDMRGKWLMPGLMNMHVHLGLRLPGAAGAALATETDQQLILRMAENARKSLLSGVTSVRLVGERHGTDFALKSAIDRGALPGPRIETAGEIIVPTGGHGNLEVNGPYGFAEAVRDQVEQGASWIKIAISGGISDSLGSLTSTPMTDEEISMVMEIARRNGVKVTAHNGSSAAALQALKFGINGFEHGYDLNDEVLAKMKKQGAYLVPTIVVSQQGAQEFFRKIGSPPWYLERVRMAGTTHYKMLQSAIRQGVPIALGTDQFPYEPNEGTTATIREAELYVEAGMKPIDALRAATIVPARMMARDHGVGSIKVGKYADIIALQSNPLSDIKALRTLNFVMKNGRVVRDDSTAAPLP